MTRSKLFFCLLIIYFFSLPINSFSQRMNNDEKNLMQLIDTRSFAIFDTSKFGREDFNYFMDSLKEKIILGFANIADSNLSQEYYFRDALNPTSDKYKNLRLTAYFALGQFPGDSSRKLLSELLQLENSFLKKSYDLKLNCDVDFKSELLNSIGKVGDERMYDEILNEYKVGDQPDSVLMRAVAMSIGRFALRKIKNERGIETLKYFVNNTSDVIALRNSAFAFWRIGDKALLDNAKDEIYKLTQSPDIQTRQWAFSAMGKLKDEVFLLDMLEKFDQEICWGVKVNMLNSLTNFNMDSVPHLQEKILDVLGGYKKGEIEHISLMRLNTVGKLFAGKRFSGSEDVKQGLIEILNSNEYTSRIQSEAANTLSLVYKDSVKKDLFDAFGKTDNYDVKAGIIRAFGNFDDGLVYKDVRKIVSDDVQNYNKLHPNTTGELIGSNDLAKLYRGFVDMLSQLYPKVGKDDQNTIRLMFTEFTGSRDPYIVDVCLTSLKDTLFNEYRRETNSVLLFDYKELSYPKDMTTMLLFIDALGELKDTSSITLLTENLSSPNYDIGKASADALQKINWKVYPVGSVMWTDYDWDYMAKLSQMKYITVKTNKGDIKIELLPEVAPFTVMNFLKLAQSNYYDGTIFHRVVPNFVIQGGDPTGTGFGGPGYAIRSEFSPLRYDRGMVGMASSGKDTEGSQFFITHTATPHLDGRYTIFGKVTEGMDEVVDQIMIGDYVEDVIID